MEAKKQLKILITADASPGMINGVWVSFSTLRTELEKRGHEVRLLIPSADKQAAFRDGVWYAPSVSGERIYHDLRMCRRRDGKLMREICAWQPDVIHSQTEGSIFWVYAAALAKRLRIPMVHTMHTMYEDYSTYVHISKRMAKLLLPRIYAWYARRLDSMIVPSPKVAASMASIQGKIDMPVIPTGISCELFRESPDPHWIAQTREKLGIPEDCRVLLYLGRVAKEKNIEHLMALMAESQEPRAMLVIAGDGPDRPALEAMASQLKLDGRVRFTGMIPREQVPQYYHIGDVFVNGSTSETQGLTYYEAMAAGLPLLCQADACLDLLVENGVTGWTFDSDAIFHARLHHLLADDERRRAMGRQAQAHVEQFSSANFAAATEQVYRTVIARRQGR